MATTDSWNLVITSLEERRKEPMLVEHCDRLRGDPMEIRRVLCAQLVIRETEAIDAGVDMVIVGFADSPPTDFTAGFVDAVLGAIRS